MALSDLPRISLTELPTPVTPMKSLSDQLGGPDIYIKRDDLTGLGLGGNKTRKLEYLLGDAKDKNRNTLITAGGIQSNHCRLTAAAATACGFKCELILAGKKPDIPNGNLLLDYLYDAGVNWCTREKREETLYDVADRVEKEGGKPYVIPVGGSDSVGSVGYVNAMFELKKQLKLLELKPDYIIFATSSGGTQAGLTLGARMTGFSGKILGMSIDQLKTGGEPFPPILKEIANSAAGRLESDIRFEEKDFLLNCDYLGAGYAVPGKLEWEAIRMTARQEGILLGPVYTARAMGGLFDLIRKGVITRNESVLFWHTGGTPELFAYAQEAMGSLL